MEEPYGQGKAAVWSKHMQTWEGEGGYVDSDTDVWYVGLKKLIMTQNTGFWLAPILFGLATLHPQSQL